MVYPALLPLMRTPRLSVVDWTDVSPPPCRFKWTRPFRRKKKSGFWAWAITFQTQSTNSLQKAQRPVTHRDDKVLLYFLGSTRYKYHINRYCYWICRFTTYGNSPSVPSWKFFYCVLINAGKRGRQLSPHIHTLLLRFLWGRTCFCPRRSDWRLPPTGASESTKISQSFSLSIDLLGSSPLRKHTAIPHARSYPELNRFVDWSVCYITTLFNCTSYKEFNEMVIWL